MKIVVSVLLVLFSFLSFSQTISESVSFYDVNAEFGLFASLNSHPYENLVGEKYTIQATYFFHPKFGFRSGFSNVKSMEGTNKFYSIPLLFVYRTSTYRPSNVYIHADSFSDLFVQLIGSIMPRQFEFNIGANLGYIEPEPDLYLLSINDGPAGVQGFSTEQRFVSTLDFGLRGKAKIKRFAFTVSPTVSYLITSNFRYNSEQYPNLEYDPKWFMSMMLGLSYEF